MESQSISLGDLFSVELFVGSITFVLGTVLFFLLLLLNLRLNLKTTLLYCCLQLILVVSLSTIFFIFWRFNFDIMIGFLYLPGAGEESVVDCDGVFVSVGRQPATALAVGQLELDGGGYIVAGETTETSIPGVYAVGDVRTKPLRQVVTAVADGAVAVHMAEKYIAENR